MKKIKNGIFAKFYFFIFLKMICLFVFQWLIGFVSFLAPGLNLSFRQFLMPLHTFFGLGIFAMAIVAVISGITEKAIFAM